MTTFLPKDGVWEGELFRNQRAKVLVTVGLGGRKEGFCDHGPDIPSKENTFSSVTPGSLGHWLSVPYKYSLWSLSYDLNLSV